MFRMQQHFQIRDFSGELISRFHTTIEVSVSIYLPSIDPDGFEDEWALYMLICA